MASKDYKKLFQEAEASPEYWAEVTIGDFTEEICRLLVGKNTTRAELARRLQTTPAYVTKVLRGNANLTLASMAKIAFALESQVRIHLAPKGSCTTWKDLLGEPEETWRARFKSHSTILGQQQVQPNWDDLSKAFSQQQEMHSFITTREAPVGPQNQGPVQGGGNDPSTAAA
jgi:transcriptional regulator with XRE-family HTH domain